MGAFTIQIYQKFFDFKREKVYNVLILKRTEDSHSGLVHYLGKVATGETGSRVRIPHPPPKFKSRY